MELVYQKNPVVDIAGNRFIDVPTVLQFEDTPMIEVGQFEQAGFTTRFPVFYDGKKIAVVVGTRIFPTAEASRLNVTRRVEANLMVCELEGKPILELRHSGPTSLKGWAELYAPSGVLVRLQDEGAKLFKGGGNALQIGKTALRGSTFEGCKIGILIEKGGDIALGVGGGSLHLGHLGPIGE